MKKASVFLVLLMAVLTSFATNAQSLNSKAFTIHTYLGLYMEGDELMSYDVNEVYNVSLADGYLIHNIFTDGLVTDSQVYKLSNIKNTSTEGETTYTFNATSGVSGKIYLYEISTDAEDATTLTLTQPEGDKTIYMATLVLLKSYKQ
jgi:hypothetical protein